MLTDDRRIGAGARRLVGREAELQRIREALAEPCVALIEGEAGIGKSRLLQEVVAGRRALIAICPPLDHQFTLGPVVEALRERYGRTAPQGLSDLAGALAPLFPEWAGALPPAPDPLADPSASQLRVYRALAELLDQLDPDVFAVEDVHWADEATLEFLLFLESRRSRRLSIIVTYRPDEIAADSLVRRLSSRGRRERVSLHRLDAAHTGDLVSSMLDDEQVSTAFADFLHRHTDGVPFAIEESVRLLRDKSDIVRFDGEWVRRTLDEIGVPPTIRDSVLERVGRLPPTAQRLVRTAAVFGEPTREAELLSAARVAEPEGSDALAAVLQHGVLVENSRGGIAFNHALAARAVYDALAGPERRRLHGAVAAVLDRVSPRPVARLVHHFREAGDLDQWIANAEEAAKLAIAAGDHGTAFDLLLELVSVPELPAAALARVVRTMPLLTCAAQLGRSGVVATLRASLDRVGLSPQERGELRERLGWGLVQSNLYDEAFAEFEKAIPDLAHRPEDAAFAMSVLATPYSTDRTAEEHRRWLDAAADAITQDFSPQARLGLLINRMTVLLDLGDAEGWQILADLPEPPQTGRGQVARVRTQLNAGHGAMLWGRYDEARRLLQRGEELAQEYGTQLAHLGVTLVHLDWHTGRWAGLADRARAFVDLEDQAVIGLDAMTVLGQLAMADGSDPAQARHQLEAVVAECSRRGLVEYVHEPLAALARLELAAGRPARAVELTDSACEVIVRKRTWLWGTDLIPARVAALCAAGRASDAHALVETYAGGVLDVEAPVARAVLATLRAMLAEVPGDHARAAQLFAGAATSWAALPRPYAALLARERAAVNLLAAGEVEEGVAILVPLAGELAALGAGADAARIGRRLRERGVEVRRPWRGGRRGYGDQLSPRELEVVRLVASGMTNPEIARAVFRSPKTVAAQLRSAMGKLGVSSRTALAMSAAQAGLLGSEDPDRRRAEALPTGSDPAGSAPLPTS